MRRTPLSRQTIQNFPKMLTHEHLDCSLRPQTMLELWDQLGFDNAQQVKFPQEIPEAWAKAGKSKGKRQAVARQYQEWIAGHASASLKYYVDAIVCHALPLMQTEENLTRITRERIEDAVADGIVAMELRFAPQLHTWQGLSLDAVMQAVIAGIKDSPIPVKLIVCALRHQDGKMARRLSNLAIKYRKHVAKFDLAADEHANPGVLKWWIKPAMDARKHGIEPTVHLWETEEPTAQDIKLLEKYNIQVLGHGIRGSLQGNRICTVCPTSNVVTGQIKSLQEHPINKMYERGVRVTIETDGTLFTQTDLTNEYRLLNKAFGWGKEHFLRCNLTAIEQSQFSGRVKSRLRRQMRDAYSQAKNNKS